MEDLRKLLRDQIKAAEAVLQNELLFNQKTLDPQALKFSDNWGERKLRYNVLHDSRSETSGQYNQLVQWVLKDDNAVLAGLVRLLRVDRHREWVLSNL